MMVEAPTTSGNADWWDQNGLTTPASAPGPTRTLPNQYGIWQGLNGVYYDSSGNQVVGPNDATPIQGAANANNQDLTKAPAQPGAPAAPPPNAPPAPAAQGALPGAPAPPTIAPFSYQPWTQTFSAPTADQAANTPGYQDALKQAQQALARSAAANGTLLTGGTAKALEQQAVSYANQNYQNVYNQAANTYNTNFSTYQQGLVNALQTYAFNANLTQTQYQNLLQQYGLNVANTNTANNLGLAYDTLNSNNTNTANQLGLGYAGLYGNTLMGGAGGYANYLTGAASSSAAGNIGTGNAWAGALGGLGNTALYTALLGNTRTGTGTPQQTYGGNGLPGYSSVPM